MRNRTSTLPLFLQVIDSRNFRTAVLCCTDDIYSMYFIKKYFKDVSREFDEFQVNTYLCKLRCWYL